MAKKTLGTAKRFGPRYGKTVKDKVSLIEKSQRMQHKCPYCLFVKVKRVASGIWKCKKCGAVFAGRAYSPEKRKISFKVDTGETLVDEKLLKDEKELAIPAKKKGGAKPAEVNNPENEKEKIPEEKKEKEN